MYIQGSTGGSVVKNLPANAGDVGLIPGLGKTPEKEIETYSSILAWKNPTDRGAWQAAVYGVEKGWRQLSNWTCMHINISSIYIPKKEIWSTTQ